MTLSRPKQVTPGQRMGGLKTFLELARLIEDEQRAELERTRQDRRKQKQARADRVVAGGVYRPDPIDRAAAMMCARAPWWAFAPSERAATSQEKPKMPERNGYVTKAIPRADPILNELGLANMDELAARICARIEHQVPKELRELAECAVNARGVLDASIKDIGLSMEEFERVTKAASQQVRTQRMTIVSECSSAVNALKDVRQFFLGPDYEREAKRLAEFVDLCERLKRLKDSGFLDTVADTMIRLAKFE